MLDVVVCDAARHPGEGNMFYTKGKNVYAVTAWLLQHAIYDTTRILLRFLMSWQPRIDEGLIQARKPLLFAVAPHTSTLDNILLPAALPRRLLPIRWIADRKIFSPWYRGVWLKLWGAVPARIPKRGGVHPQEVENVVDLARCGQSVSIFPECCMAGGSFNKNHAQLLKSCLDSSIAVVPVTLVGSKEIRFKHKEEHQNPLTVYLSAPIKTTKATEGDLGAILAEIMEKSIPAA